MKKFYTFIASIIAIIKFPAIVIPELKLPEPTIDATKETFSAEEVKTLLNKTQQETRDVIIKEADKASEAEITSRVKDEKDKLYKSVEAEKGRAQKAEQKLSEIEKELTALRAGNQSGLTDKEALEKISKLNEELATTRQQLADSQKLIDDKLAEVEKRVTDTTQQALTAERVTNLRKELIEKAKGEILPELVTGTTEEELRASAEVAKARYKEIADKSQESLKNELIQNGQLSVSGERIIDRQSQRKILGEGSIFALSKEEFDKKAAEVLKKY